MNELISINYNSENPTVLGRELHEALEVKTAYKDWFPRMCEYGFTENVDYTCRSNLSSENQHGGQNKIDPKRQTVYLRAVKSRRNYSGY